jgi:hypothetical protein
MKEIVVRDYGPDDCEPPESGKHWLSIEDKDAAGNEYAIIVVREPYEITIEHWERAYAIARFLEQVYFNCYCPKCLAKES